MSLFRKVGQKFEETKQAFIEGGDDPFVCRACETTVAEAYEFCPHCGEDAVEPIE